MVIQASASGVTDCAQIMLVLGGLAWSCDRVPEFSHWLICDISKYLIKLRNANPPQLWGLQLHGMAIMQDGCNKFA